MSDAPVQLVGDFDGAEARFLRSQFDDCQIKLIARSLRDGRTALLRWQPATGLPPHAVETTTPRVTDRRRRPPVAWYVLEHEPEIHLTPIASGPDLRDRFPDHFPADAVPDQPARTGCLPFSRWFLPLALAIALASS